MKPVPSAPITAPLPAVGHLSLDVSTAVVKPTLTRCIVFQILNPEAGLMKLNSMKATKVEKDLPTFYTNALTYLMKRFNFSDKNYLKHTECLSLSCEIEYQELQKAMAMMRFQPMVIMGIKSSQCTLHC
jgi:hypothetical protein